MVTPPEEHRIYTKFTRNVTIDVLRDLRALCIARGEAGGTLEGLDGVT